MAFGAAVFDWGGTLTPWHDLDVRQSWAAFARGYGTMACALNDLTARLWAGEGAAWRRARESHAATTLAELLAEVGIDPDSPAAEAGLSAYWQWWEPHTLTHPLVWSTLRGLRQAGLRIGVLSNTMWPRSYHEALFVRDDVAGFIDAQVYSCEVGVTKPHEAMFEAILGDLGVEPGEAVYIGDRLHEDIAGAQRVGMRTVHLDHPMFAGDHLHPSEARPDATISQLDEVVSLVGAWGHPR